MHWSKNMAVMNNDRSKIIDEFETMKSFELSAHNLYTRIADDPRVSERKVKDAFRKLAEDERRHADLVQEIIDLIEKA